jgi:hypothetical protein
MCVASRSRNVSDRGETAVNDSVNHTRATGEQEIRDVPPNGLLLGEVLNTLAANLDALARRDARPYGGLRD